MTLAITLYVLAVIACIVNDHNEWWLPRLDGQWWLDHGEVMRLARWLHKEGTFSCCEDLLSFFDKPWNWSVERDEMLAVDA